MAKDEFFDIEDETEDVLTPEMIKYNIIGNPVTIQTIVEALSERTRLFILKHLQGKSYGLTATEIAKLVNKRVPTILYHLEHLKKAGLVFDELKPRVEGDRRGVKHWLIANKRVTLDVDLDTLSYLHRTLESYLLSFLAFMRTNGIVSQDSLAAVTLNDIIAHQRVSEDFAVVIKDNLDVEKISVILKNRLDDEFSQIADIEKRVKAIIKKNYLRDKAIPLLNKELMKVFGRVDASLLSRISDELLKRRVGTSQHFRAFISDIAGQYRLVVQIPLRLAVQEIAARYGVSLGIAVQIRNLLLSTGKYAVDRTERLFLR
ncbi:MAG: ArsR/SmtB family transcription factor [Candidatus Hodarchaeota archaeon]